MRNSILLLITLLDSSYVLHSDALWPELQELYSKGWCYFKKPSLHNAARYGDLETLKSGLACGKRIDALDKEGWTPLHHAAHFGHVDELATLLEHNASLNYRHYLTGNTPLHLAAQAGHASIVERLLQAGAVHQLAQTPGTLPIQLAALGGHTDALAVMLGHRIASGDASQREGIAAIEMAAQKGLTDACALLFKTSSVRSRAAALHWAAQHGHVRTVDALLAKGIEPDAQNSCGWRAIHRASVAGQKDVLDALLDAGADPTSAARKCSSVKGTGEEAVYPMLQSDQTMRGAPLHLASRHGRLPIVQRLLERPTEKAHEAASDGWRAAREEHRKAEVAAHHAKVAVHAMGADAKGSKKRRAHEKAVQILDAKATDAKRALDAAGSAVDAAKEAHENASHVDIDGQDDDGYTALAWGAREGHLNVVRWLLLHGASVNISEHMGGMLPLHLAAEGGRVSVLKELLKSKADPNATDLEFGFDAFMHACKGGHIDAMNLLAPHAVKERVDRSHSWTALHIAAMNGRVQAVQWLLAKGWNVWAKDHVGWTAMHWANRGSFTQVVEVLRAKTLPPTEAEVSQFTVEDVSEWLQALNMPQFVGKFLENKVDGHRLLQLTDNKLLNEFGIRQPPFRERIMQEVKQLHKMGERAAHGGEL